MIVKCDCGNKDEHCYKYDDLKILISGYFSEVSFHCACGKIFRVKNFGC